jgi:hypothetical protein
MIYSEHKSYENLQSESTRHFCYTSVICALFKYNTASFFVYEQRNVLNGIWALNN